MILYGKQNMGILFENNNINNQKIFKKIINDKNNINNNNNNLKDQQIIKKLNIEINKLKHELKQKK